MARKRDRQYVKARRETARKKSFGYLKYKAKNGKKTETDNPGGMARLDRKERGNLRIEGKRYLRQDMTLSKKFYSPHNWRRGAIKGVNFEAVMHKITKNPKKPFAHLSLNWA